MKSVLTTAAIIVVITSTTVFLASSTIDTIAPAPEAKEENLEEILPAPREPQPQKPTTTATEENQPAAPSLPPRENLFRPENFRGPTGQPHMIGPRSNPPNY
jgi:hypothetical protein